MNRMHAKGLGWKHRHEKFRKAISFLVAYRNIAKRNDVPFDLRFWGSFTRRRRKLIIYFES